MKNLSFLLLILIVKAFFLSCSNNQKNTENADFIIGIWQNTNSPESKIEFKKSGEYIVWIRGETAKESLKYIYDPTAKVLNLKISEDLKNDTLPQREKLEVIDSNKIKITLFLNGSVFSASEYTRIK